MTPLPNAARDAIVVGAGLAGLAAALRLARAGASVTLVTRGVGGLQLSQGSLDVLGYAPQRVTRPYDSLPAFAAAEPGHPYALLGADAVRVGVDFVTEVVGPALLAPGDGTNLQLPTAVGAVRPTAVAQPSMVAGQVIDGKRFVVVGLRRLKDFQASLVAANLARTVPPGGGVLEARHAWIDVEVRAGEHDTTGLNHARALDDPAFRERFARAVAGVVRDGETVLLPAVLGLDDPDAFRHLQRLIGQPIAEVPLPPPGVPGMRLFRALSAAARDAGVRFINGSPVVGLVSDAAGVSSLAVGETGRRVALRALAFVFAPGGFESGALAVDSYGRITETALGLPLTCSDAKGLISADFWGTDQALFRVGVAVDDAMRVVDAAGAVVHPNLYAAGGVLAGASRWRELSGEGIAAASGVRAAESILQEAR